MHQFRNLGRKYTAQQIDDMTYQQFIDAARAAGLDAMAANSDYAAMSGAEKAWVREGYTDAKMLAMVLDERGR